MMIHEPKPLSILDKDPYFVKMLFTEVRPQEEKRRRRNTNNLIEFNDKYRERTIEISRAVFAMYGGQATSREYKTELEIDNPSSRLHFLMKEGYIELVKKGVGTTPYTYKWVGKDES